MTYQDLLFSLIKDPIEKGEHSETKKLLDSLPESDEKYVLVHRNSFIHD